MTDEWPTLPPAGGRATERRSGSFAADYWVGDADALKAIVAQLEAAMEKAYLAFRSGRSASAASRLDVEAYALQVSVFADGATWDGPLDETFSKVDPTKVTSLEVRNSSLMGRGEHPHVTLKMELVQRWGSKTVSLSVSGSDVQWIAGLVAAVSGLVEKGRPKWVRWKPVEVSRGAIQVVSATVVTACATALVEPWVALLIGVAYGAIAPSMTGWYRRHGRMAFWFPKFEVTKPDGRSQGERSLATMWKIASALGGAIGLGLAIWGAVAQSG